MALQVLPLKLLVVKPCDFPPEILTEMRLRNVKSVVDVGCGKGVALPFLQEFDYVGVDKGNYSEDVKTAHPHAKLVWNTKIQDYVPREPFDAAWCKCIFCLWEIDNEEMQMIVAWLKKWAKHLFLVDTPRIDIEWQGMLAEAGFELEVHGNIVGIPSVMQVWRNATLV